MLVLMLSFLAINLLAPSLGSSDSDHAIITGTSHIRFLAIGDWGGQAHPPYYSKGQWETAKGMSKVAAASAAGGGSEISKDGALVWRHFAENSDYPAASFVLALGDNFYYGGLEDNEGRAQMRFEETFDKVYSHPNLQVPWYVLGGNHDYCGDITKQLQLSKANERWNFPDYNYRIVREFSPDKQSPSVKVEILMIDTIQLAGVHCPTSEDLSDEFFAAPTPPELTNDVASKVQAHKTLDWIENALENSDADYLLVAGHYGIYSACSHGNNAHLATTLDPLLTKYGATAYLSGHDHCQFHFAHENMNYVLSGAGAYCCYGAKNKKHLPRGGDLKFLHADTHDYSGRSKFIHAEATDYSGEIQGGFLSFDVSRDKMVLSFHRENGNTLHESVLLPRDKRFKMRMRESIVIEA